MIKKIVTMGLLCCMFLLCGTNMVKAAPPNEEDSITISSPDDLKGCYYNTDSGGVQTWDKTKPCFKDEKLQKAVYDNLVSFYEAYPPLSNIGPASTSPNFTNIKQDPDNPMKFSAADASKKISIRDILYEYRGDLNARSKGLPQFREFSF